MFVCGLTKSNQTQPDHSNLNQTKPNLTKPNQIQLYQTRLNHTKPNLNQTKLKPNLNQTKVIVIKAKPLVLVMHIFLYQVLLGMEDLLGFLEEPFQSETMGKRIFEGVTHNILPPVFYFNGPWHRAMYGHLGSIAHIGPAGSYNSA